MHVISNQVIGNEIINTSIIMLKTVKIKNETSTKLTFGGKLYQKASSMLLKIIPYLPSHHKYNLTICHEKKFIWFRVAKVGTRTILNALKNSNIHLDAEHPHNCHYPKHLYKDHLKFAFIRNPYDRLVSCWKNKVVHNNYFRFSDKTLMEMQKFENFVDYVASKNIEKCNAHFRLQSKLIDLNEIDYIGRFENFESDLSHIFQLLKINNPSFERLNSTNNGEHYSEYYDQKLRMKVGKIYEKDLNIFSYKFENAKQIDDMSESAL